MKKISLMGRALLFITVLALPAFAFAAGVSDVTGGFKSIGEVVNSFTSNIVTALSTLFATMAMVAFFWGIVQYIWGIRDGNPEQRKKGNDFMIWGLVALFVMFSVWGIIRYAQGIFKIEGQNTIVIPSIDIQTGGTKTTPSATGLPPGAPTPFQPKSCNGVTYYSENDYLKGCTTLNNSGGSSPLGTGADCSGNSQCNSGLVCRNYTCKQPCSAYNNASACSQAQCSWSNSELSCSQ